MEGTGLRKWNEELAMNRVCNETNQELGMHVPYLGDIHILVSPGDTACCQ